MIIESIVTTLAPDGAVNVAPMGVEWGEEEIVLKPFVETATFRNLDGGSAAVVNLIDDVLLFAQAALGNPSPPVRPAAVVRGMVLADACSWRELEPSAIDDAPPRARIVARVVHRGVQREFLGFNRARHAVIEGAILATRTHLLEAAQIAEELARLRVWVQKTAGAREFEAWALLERTIAERLAAPRRAP